MTTRVLKKLNLAKLSVILPSFSAAVTKSLLLFSIILCVLVSLYQIDHGLFDVIVSALADAYLGVSIFIALTLGGFYFLDQCFKADLTQVLNQGGPLQVPVAAFLGALPGCGGAIIVVTQFVNGKMSFGALVAVLISTMGDAAFLLLSKKPDIALLVYGVSLIAGIVTGYLVNWYHGHNYLKTNNPEPKNDAYVLPRLPPLLVFIFILLLAPATVFGVLEAFQWDSNQLFGEWAHLEPTKWFAFVGALLCILVWVSQPLDSWSARFAEKAEIRYLKETVVAETSFVSVWVIVGFLAYELLVYATGINLQTAFSSLGGVTILLAILIGFIPGCGPQIVMTSLYINGVVPLSAQLANAISNDGDALFPALALAPEAAVKATIYSAIPAFIVGYTSFYMGY